MKIIDKIWDYVETWMSVFAMLIMIISIFLQIIFRYVIQSALPWSEESARYAMIYLTFIGVSAGTKIGAHFAVTVFVEALPKKLQNILNTLVHLLCAVLFAAYLLLAIDMAQNIYSTGQLTPAMQLPVYLIYSSLPLGFAGAVFRNVQIVIQDIKTLRCADSESGSVKA
ncbi:MAG: TRAP transporter small permease [Planctomycetota bacterium]|jgi:C4-dicarboxylate transporter DctQ subunit|nr:TRAP transporter small permease [Planctomycetota bacterium]